MATYVEIKGLFGDTALKSRIAVACIIAAETIRNEDTGTVNHPNRLLWAKEVFGSPNSTANKMMMAILAANKDLTMSQMQNAADNALQTAVDNAVDLFANGS